LVTLSHYGSPFFDCNVDEADIYQHCEANLNLDW